METASVDPKDLSVVITSLMPETLYRFRVIAQNALGRSKPSQETIIRTEEEGNFFHLNHLIIDIFTIIH